MRKPQPKQRKATRVPAIPIPRQLYFQFETLAKIGALPKCHFEHFQPMSARRYTKKKIA